MNNIEINVNYNELFGLDWIQHFSDELFLQETVDFMIDIEQEYMDNIVYPNKKDIFKPFQLCKPKDLKIVILTPEPYCDGKSNGLGLGNKSNVLKISPELEKIKERIEGLFYNNLNLNFDITLEDWAKQGVLMLNTAMTVIDGKPGSHAKLWKDFMISIIQAIDYNFNDIIFFLWGSRAQEFEPYISTEYNTIYKHYDLKLAVDTDSGWYCSNFDLANNRIRRNKGEQHTIVW